MGILSFINKVCVQTAVYWGDPTPDGRGKYTWGTVKDVKVRWDGKNETIINKYGKQIVSRSEIMVTEKLGDNGYLWLGSINDLPSGESTDPTTLPDAYPIQSIATTPLFAKSDQFVYTIYL